MRALLLFSTDFDPLFGGLEIWTHQLSQYLLEAGHEVHVVAFDFREPTDPRLIIHRLQNLQANWNEQPLLNNVSDNLTSMWSMIWASGGILIFFNPRQERNMPIIFTISGVFLF